MNVLMICSARNEIDDYYKSVARSISHFLAINDCDLVYSGGSQSMMGICYDEFSRMNRNIYAYTNHKYKEDLLNLPNAKHFLCETTFDIKKEMFENSDMIICLPGGIGTLSELLSYIEEKRTNDRDIPLIIYDEDGYYNEILSFIKVMLNKKFNDNDACLQYSIASNKEEFEEQFYNYYYNVKRRVK